MKINFKYLVVSLFALIAVESFAQAKKTAHYGSA